MKYADRLLGMITIVLISSSALAQEGDKYDSPYRSVDSSGAWAHYVTSDPAVAPVGTNIALFRGSADGSARDIVTFGDAQALCGLAHDGVSGWRLPASPGEVQPTRAMEYNRAWGIKDGVVGRFWRNRTAENGTNPDFKLIAGFTPATPAEQERDLAPVVCVHSPYKAPKR